MTRAVSDWGNRTYREGAVREERLIHGSQYARIRETRVLRGSRADLRLISTGKGVNVVRPER